MYHIDPPVKTGELVVDSPMGDPMKNKYRPRFAVEDRSSGLPQLTIGC
jgi:hypothetical protein